MGIGESESKLNREPGRCLPTGAPQPHRPLLAEAAGQLSASTQRKRTFFSLGCGSRSDAFRPSALLLRAIANPRSLTEWAIYD
jgi:hypothetical protein